MMERARVRHMVGDLEPALRFYADQLGFAVERHSPPHFAMLSRGPLELILSAPFGPGGAAKPMLDGSRPVSGGWNRIILNVEHIAEEVSRLKGAGVHFRNDVATGPGGSEILLDGPSGNPVELFEPASPNK